MVEQQNKKLGGKIKIADLALLLLKVFIALVVIASLLAVVAFIAMWQLGIFNLGPGITVTSTGFAKMKPQLASVTVTPDGQFTAIFTNGVGAPISIQEVNITDAINPSYSCRLTEEALSPNNPIAGQNTRIVSTTGCLSPSKHGDPYTVQVSIYYEVTIGDITVKHVDTGNIRGLYE